MAYVPGAVRYESYYDVMALSTVVMYFDAQNNLLLKEIISDRNAGIIYTAWMPEPGKGLTYDEAVKWVNDNIK